MVIFAEGAVDAIPGWVFWLTGTFVTAVIASVFAAWGRSQYREAQWFSKELERRKETDKQDQDRALFRDAQFRELIVGLQEEIKRLRSELLSHGRSSDARKD